MFIDTDLQKNPWNFYLKVLKAYLPFASFLKISAFPSKFQVRVLISFGSDFWYLQEPFLSL